MDSEIQSYADLAFRARRQNIDDEYQRELGAKLEKLASNGVGHNSSAREATELRLKAEKLTKLILAKAEVLIEAFRSHGAPLNEKEILDQVYTALARNPRQEWSPATRERRLCTAYAPVVQIQPYRPKRNPSSVN